mmetsp:Transcript_6312/g.11493  ORF Transcript_6312/g.11493 Transcript_6312/m.11493 type:complete len:100 (-) Transcript_6312:143-442(-)|eukprot:CAMPEP_0202506990 /NCGR_PEP_ID=MMETSP1361-20130828/51485_1 /ASSEMBLY_ACC=CAM_ASM_000849 /TAXON_ID=210615 /ORGANISM="Staurosira complex sp., Strain CCMP2646" /LENGTH=99 /DNA_ID=CAMNT_0049141081 /DNA_START=95 /DNA_END=394 /DNA_ORIENTATION=+
MRLLSLVMLVALAMNAEAFTTKKRDPARSAFSSVSNGAVPAAAVEHETTSAAADQPVFKGMVPIQVEVLEDEIEIGYTTALVACVASLALGFGLGYGAL